MATGEAATPDLDVLSQSAGELERCQADLLVARRELDSFTYAVAHDLRAPLRSIIGFNQALVEDCADALDATAQGYLQRVQENANRLEQMLDGLLLLSRVGRSEMKWQPVDLSTLVHEAVSKLRAQEPQRRVEVLVTPGLHVEGDAVLLRQAVEHLVGNAWKFTVHQPQAYLEFGMTAANEAEPSQKPAYFLRDNGVGFNGKYAGRLFEAFQRLHGSPEFAGIGIGLALIQRVMRRHRGEAWIEGAVGQGATVYFRL